MGYNNDMRKRCFIIAFIAIALGVTLILLASPSDRQIEAIKGINKAMSDVPGRTYLDPYQHDIGMLRAAQISFFLAGVLFIVGFIVGPPKETTSKSPPEES